MSLDRQGSSAMDRYVVLEYLAEGGMGAIYVGKRMGAGGFERPVVLKQLLPEFTKQPEFIDLFLREARLSATLDHANIVHTIDLVTAGDDYFIVMEYLDGADLRALMKRSRMRRKPLSPSACLYIARELLTALSYAHNKTSPSGGNLGLIHRDISPSNILVSASGDVKLTDFGIAKASTHNSVFYKVKGKVGYMSPEQARSKPIDARSDLYSFAVCLYEAFTGEKLFVNKGITTSADEMYSQPIPLVSRKVDGIPADIDKLMLKALAVDPDGRFQTAAEFQEAVLRCTYKNGFMMTSSQLSAELRESCGPPEEWRQENDNQPQGKPTEGTEQIDLAEFADEDGEIDLQKLRPPKNEKAAATKLNELQGLELTSMINLTAVEADEEPVGAAPLVEFNDYDNVDFQTPPPTREKPKSAVARPESAIAFNDTPPPMVMKRRRRKRSSWKRTLLTLGFILLLGVATAVGIGFTGPTIDPQSLSE